MCKPSTVADDWVVKGFHIHVGAVELVVRPDHLGGLVFRKMFAETSDADADVAIRLAIRDCLPDASVRRKWRDSLRRAMDYVRGHAQQGYALADRANGRQLEFQFLILALDRFEA